MIDSAEADEQYARDRSEAFRLAQHMKVLADELKNKADQLTKELARGNTG